MLLKLHHHLRSSLSLLHLSRYSTPAHHLLLNTSSTSSMAINIGQLNAQLADSKARLEAARIRNDQRLKDAKRHKSNSIGRPRWVSPTSYRAGQDSAQLKHANRITSGYRDASTHATKDAQQRSEKFRQKPQTEGQRTSYALSKATPRNVPSIRHVQPAKYKRTTPQLDSARLQQTVRRMATTEKQSKSRFCRENSILTSTVTDPRLSFSEALATSSPNVSRAEEEDVAVLAVRSAKTALKSYLNGTISLSPQLLLQLINCVCQD